MAKILHVEDESMWRDIIKRKLEAEGHQVVSCSTLIAAAKAYDKGSFELVICDGSVGIQGNGVEWAEKLHAQGQKVVVVSGYAKTEVPFVPKSAFDVKQVLRVLG